MYKIYCDDVLIYHQNLEELKVTNATVELEQNKIGSFTFTIYPTNPYINLIKDMQSIITVYQDDHILFKGIAVNSSYAFKNQKTVKCKQDYHFLTFSNQRTYKFNNISPKDLFTHFINEHNKQVDVKHQFKIGEVTVTDPNNSISRSDSNYTNTWDSINKKLIEPLGGYLRLRHVGKDTFIDYLSDFSLNNTQEIVFGENMLDVKKEVKGLEIATVLIPLGAKIEGEETENGAEKHVDITSVNNGLDYIEDTESVKQYGKIVKIKRWDNVTEPRNLLNKAIQELNRMIMKTSSIEISALDMANVNKDIKNFKMHQYIKVKSAFHKIDNFYLPLKMNINLFVPQNNKITLNAKTKTLTDEQIEQDKSFGDIITNIENIQQNQGAINGNIAQLDRVLTSKIEQSKDTIKQEVSEQYFTKDDTKKLLKEQSALVEQKADGIYTTITNLQKELNEMGESTQLVKTYFKVTDKGLAIAQDGNDTSTLMANDHFAILIGTQEVVQIFRNMIKGESANFSNSVQIGHIKATAYENGIAYTWED